MNIPLLYEVIAKKQLFELFKQENHENGEVLHFKRHNSSFRFLKKIDKSGEAKFSLLKGNDKARLGTLRELWSDYLELDKNPTL